MKRIFFVMYLVLFLSSCEDDINSPDYNDNDVLGCPDPVACNFDPFVDINDGSCIYGLPDSIECLAFDDCELNGDNTWINHTCLDSNDLPFLNWDGYESNCGYVYQNGGYIYQQAVNDGEPCDNLIESACDDACTWNSDSQECELAYICENEDGSALDGWDSESPTAQSDCINTSICINSLGESLDSWNFGSETENDCNNAFIYTPGSCTLEDSEDDNNSDDGGTESDGTDGGDTDDGGSDS